MVIKSIHLMAQCFFGISYGDEPCAVTSKYIGIQVQDLADLYGLLPDRDRAKVCTQTCTQFFSQDPQGSTYTACSDLHPGDGKAAFRRFIIPVHIAGSLYQMLRQPGKQLLPAALRQQGGLSLAGIACHYDIHGQLTIVTVPSGAAVPCTGLPAASVCGVCAWALPVAMICCTASRLLDPIAAYIACDTDGSAEATPIE